MKTPLTILWIFLLSGFLHAQEPEVVTYKKVDGRELAVHIFKPERQDSPSPAVVWYHGGGWNPKGKAGQFFEHGKILAGLGVVSISVDYRGYEGTEAKRDISHCIEDAKSAFRWVRNHADALNIDSSRIAVGGGSAGGHLAAAVATLPGFDSPQDDLSIPLNPSLQILFNPAFDPKDMAEGEFAPLHAVKKGTAPAIIFHGVADTTVSISQSYDFQRAMDKVGSECVVMAYRDQSHGFFNHRKGTIPHFYITVGDMIEFLDKQGYLEPMTEKPRQTILFSGKDTQHWDMMQENGWSIVDGALEPSDAIRKNNYMWTKKTYGDFVLSLQYKLSKDANSGVFYRTDPGNPVQGGFEIQLLDGLKSPPGVPDMRNNGSIYGAVAPSIYNNKPAGEWNALMLYARGPRVTVWVNGVQTATADFDRWTDAGKNPDGSTNKFKKALATLPRVGKIGLQYHGQPVWFRNARITELTDESPDLMKTSPRPAANDEELKYWLTNMVEYHGFSDAEVSVATGLSAKEVAAARKRLNIKGNLNKK